MPDASTAGRSYASRRAVLDVIHAAVLGSYGVTGMGDERLIRRALRRAGIGRSPVRLHFDGPLTVELSLTVAHGLPVAEVARQVESGVRYAFRQAFGRDLDGVSVHVNSLRVLPSSAAPGSAAPGSGGSAPVVLRRVAGERSTHR